MLALTCLTLAVTVASLPTNTLQAVNQSHSTCVARYPNNAKACYGQYSVDTNWYDTYPLTGIVREYFFDITNITAAPDGRERQVQLVNGQFPGPTIEANWGDTIKVHVRNKLQNNGTSIHFHGIRQLRNNQNDGVQSLTQCPIAPGYEYTYTWNATEYGSSWYHSHFSLQAWEGVFGGIVIHGPATADYDEDLGSLILSDWSKETADEKYQAQITTPNTPQFQGGLLNGTNEYQFENGTIVGKRLVSTVQSGKRYRLRLVNAAMHTHYKFSIDNHTMKVIAADFTPLKPFDTKVVPIAMGQRYDIIVTADQLASSYWMRAVPQSFCSNNTAPENIKGILQYASSYQHAKPVSDKWNYGDDYQCMDIPSNQLVPWVPLNATVGNKVDTPVAVQPYSQIDGNPPLFLWEIGQTPFSVQWDDPTLRQTEQNPNKNWTAGQNVFETKKGQWTTFIIQTYAVVAHPIHLHGHDFWVLAQGLGTYSPSNVMLNTNNPIRRDTVTLATSPAPANNPTSATGAGGYVVIAFPSDNPGAWLMHCHIGFHATEGFALQVLERKDEIPALIDQKVLNSTCDAWAEYGLVNSFGNQTMVYKGPWDSGV